MEKKRKTFINILPPENTGDKDNWLWIEIPDGEDRHTLCIFCDYDPNDPDDIEATAYICQDGKKTKSYCGTVIQMIQVIAENSKKVI